MKMSSLLTGPELVFLGSKHPSDTCSLCLPPTYRECMGRKRGVAPYSQVQARYKVRDMCLVYRSSGKAGDRENWKIRVQETKWGKLLTMRPLELPGQTALNTGVTAPWLSSGTHPQVVLATSSLVWKGSVTLCMAFPKPCEPALTGLPQHSLKALPACRMASNSE